MTSLQTTMKSVSCPHARSGLTTAGCEASPSPVSPTTINETSSRPACSATIRSLGSFPDCLCSLIQRRRSSLVGSPNRGTRFWLRDCQRGTGSIQEKDWPPEAAAPVSLHRHPAPASESREEPADRAVRAPDASLLMLSLLDNVDLPFCRISSWRLQFSQVVRRQSRRASVLIHPLLARTHL